IISHFIEYLFKNGNLSHCSTFHVIEQINIALDQKGSGNFSAWVIEACRRRLCSEKRVSPEANKEKSDITELLRKQIRPD
ncbi:YlcI/YnfO family protein, partial [Bacillus sp. HC-Mk]